MADAVDAIIDRVLTRAGLDTSSPQFVTRANILECVNNMLKDLAENTEVFTKLDTSSITWATGTRSYALPSDLYDIINMYDPVNDKPLYPVTMDMLDAYNEDWREDEGEVYYFWRGMEGMDNISFWKTPGSAYDTYSPSFTYRYYPTDVTDSNSSYLPQPVRGSTKMAISYCLAELYEIYKGLRDIEQSERHRVLYERERQRFMSLDRASNRAYVYGSKQPRRQGPLGPQWPDEYPGW